MSEPKPCQCPESDVQAKLDKPEWRFWFMKCMGCEARTNTHWLKSDAIRAWNAGERK